jgi:ribonuclease D
VPRGRVLKDDTIYEIALQQPRDAEALARLRSLPRGYERSATGRSILAAIEETMAIPENELPRLPKARHAPEHASAAADLLKVLLKMVAEKHGVAPRIIANSEDLERLAAENEPDIAPLRGWRRQLFGERALQLKRGELGLSLSRKGITAVDLDASPATDKVAAE